MNFLREMADVVETLRRGRERGKSCTLLIGAGCSATAGIPTAAGFVDIIKDQYTRAYQRAREKTYPVCMSELSVSERRDLIGEYIDRAKINWGHIAIAQLIKKGYVDRVLTTNFDQLLVKACAMVGIFPASYDFAASQLFKPADVPDQAIFYLHGQRTGFVLMNTPEECDNHAKLLAPVFEDAGKKRAWLVVGYSGQCDPVFEHLAAVPRFDNRLFWIGYKDAEPSSDTRDKLLVKDKDAHYVKGFDADGFFIKLAQDLGCFPPDFIGSPFSHLDATLGMLAPYPTSGAEGSIDLVEGARRNIREAIDRYEMPATGDAGETMETKSERVPLQAAALFSAGKYDEVIALAGDLQPPFGGVPAETLYWSLVEKGNAEAEERSEEGYAAAMDMYAEAVRIKPDSHEALYNWGSTLLAQARTKEGEEADRMYEEAAAKFTEALRIKPDDHEALNNLGNTLSAQAGTKEGDDADALYREAGAKYADALRIKPDMHEALYNWGNALSAEAGTKEGEEADRLYAEAGAKYAETVRIKPDMHEALYNLGNVLSDQAQTKEGEEAYRLYAEAGAKFAEALRIKPDKDEALNNWGIALAGQAGTKEGEDADRCYAEAGAKYAEALRIRPDEFEPLYNWGHALLSQARTKTGKERDRLLMEAEERLRQGETLKPGSCSYNLACVYAQQGKEADCQRHLEASLTAGELTNSDHLAKDPDLDQVREKEWFKRLLKGFGGTEEAAS